MAATACASPLSKTVTVLASEFVTRPTRSGNGFGGTPDNGWQGSNSVEQGAFGVDIRNADGLVVMSDMRSGLWLFRLKGFTGWSGKQAGTPNVSSVQDWDNGPPKGTPAQ